MKRAFYILYITFSAVSAYAQDAHTAPTIGAAPGTHVYNSLTPPPGKGAIAPSVKPLQSDLYTKKLGFFCKQELKIEQKTKLPLRLRLGSADYCNWLESKASYKYPQKP